MWRPPLLASQACSPEANERAVEQVQERQSYLLKQQVEAMSPDIAPPVREQIHALKDALAKAVDAEMGCIPMPSEPALIEMRLAKLLNANQPEKPLTPQQAEAAQDLKPQDEVYGTNLHVAVSTPKNVPEMRVIEVSFGIDCGVDTILLIYEPSPDGWHPALRWQSGEYTDESGAFGDFLQYAVIPGRDLSPWRIAVAHGHPWCTSRWSGFDIDLLEPRVNSSNPRVVWHKNDGYVRFESEPRMTAKNDGFELRLHVGTIEGDVMVRKEIFRYRIAGDSIERMQPLAMNGRDFIDAWLQAPWSDAKRWSVAEGWPVFEKVHEDFARDRAAKESRKTYSYGRVRACSAKGRYEVEIDSDPDGPMFFTIQQGTNSFTLVNFATTPDNRCSGPDLMKKQ